MPFQIWRCVSTKSCSLSISQHNQSSILKHAPKIIKKNHLIFTAATVIIATIGGLASQTFVIWGSSAYEPGPNVWNPLKCLVEKGNSVVWLKSQFIIIITTACQTNTEARRAFSCLRSGCLCILLHPFPAWLGSCAGGWCSVWGNAVSLACESWFATEMYTQAWQRRGERWGGSRVRGTVRALALLMDRAAGLSAKSVQHCL